MINVIVISSELAKDYDSKQQLEPLISQLKERWDTCNLLYRQLLAERSLLTQAITTQTSLLQSRSEPQVSSPPQQQVGLSAQSPLIVPSSIPQATSAALADKDADEIKAKYRAARRKLLLANLKILEMASSKQK